MKTYTLRTYIDKFFDGKPVEFARANDVRRQLVNQWLENGFIVVGDTLYSKRREISRKVKKQ